MKRIEHLRIALLIATLLSAFDSNCQTTIKGRILDKNNNEPLPFVNIVITSDSSYTAKIIDGTATNEKGEFSIKTNLTKNIIKTSFIGYKPSILEVNLTKEQKISKATIDLGDILLQTTGEQLQEVSIIGKQTRIEMNNDKIVMNVDDGLSATSANAFEMLRKVPSVVIDKDENITLNGKSGILFQFDGRDIRLPWSSIKAILKGMSPNNIAKIETITNPSAKYEAEGTAGIINIVMNKEQSLGFSGDINSWWGINKDVKTGNGATVNYVDKCWTISASAGFGIFNSRFSQEMEQNIFNQSGDTTRMMYNIDDAKNKFHNLYTNLNIDYKIDDNNSIGTMLSFNKNNQPSMNNPKTVNILSSPSWQIDSFYTNDEKTKFASYDYLASIYYNHKFDSLGGQYSLSFDFSLDDNTNNSQNATSYYLPNNILQRQQYLVDTTDNLNTSYAFKFDVVQPFNQKMSLEYGVKTRLAVVDNDFKSFENMTYNTASSNHLKYKENVNAAYVSFSDKVNEKFSFRAGLRFEHTYTSIEQKATNDKITDNYFDLFPNINLNLKVGQMDNVSLTYSYRISRPDYNSLNPFVTKISDYAFTSGNPELKSQYTHNISLNYAFHYLVFLTAGYSYTNHNIEQAMVLTPNTLIVTQKPFNLGYSQNVNIGLSTMLPLGPIEWTLWLQGAYQQVHSNNALLQTNVERFSFQTWQSLAVDFFFHSKFNVSVFYLTGGVQMGGEFDDLVMLSLSLSKEFFNKQLKISLGVDNIPKRDFHLKTNYNNYAMDMNMCWQRPQFTINATYSFGKSSDNNTLKRIKSDDMNSRTGGSSLQQNAQGSSSNSTPQ